MLPGIEQVDPRLRGKRPIVVLSRAVYPLEGLFVKQTGHAVFPGHLFHNLHRQLILIHRNIGGIEYGRKLVLGGRHLVVFCFGEYPVRPQGFVQIVHIRRNTRLKHAEIMILQLLAAGRGRTEQRPARQHEILPLVENFPIYKKILLLGAHRGGHLFAIDPEQLQNAFCSAVERSHGFEQRRFFIQRFARIGHENGGDIEGALLDERRRRGVPGGVAPRGAGGSRAPRGKGGSVRLAHNQRFSRQLHNHHVAAARFDKAVVLFRRHAAQGLEPVREMRCAMLQRPGLHRVGDLICRGKGKRLPAL